jgi:hypothetical protein
MKQYQLFCFRKSNRPSDGGEQLCVYEKASPADFQKLHANCLERRVRSILTIHLASS